MFALIFWSGEFEWNLWRICVDVRGSLVVPAELIFEDRIDKEIKSVLCEVKRRKKQRNSNQE